MTLQQALEIVAMGLGHKPTIEMIRYHKQALA